MSLPDERFHPYATGLAAETVAKHQDPQDLVFYAGWVNSFTDFALQVKLIMNTRVSSFVHLFSEAGLRWRREAYHINIKK